MKALYHNLNKTAFGTCLIFSILLLTVSFIVPPTGVISPSVLTGVGEVFGFAALGVVIIAIEKGSDITLNRGDINLTLNNPDNNTISKKD